MVEEVLTAQVVSLCKRGAAFARAIATFQGHVAAVGVRRAHPVNGGLPN